MSYGKLSIALFEPLWRGSGILEEDLSYRVNSYGHEIKAVGGFDSCAFTVGSSVMDAERWYERIGSHIEVSNAAGIMIWEGFVNSINISVGGMQITRGPLTDIVNRLTVSYSEVSRSYEATNRTMGGEQLYTDIYNDVPSQATWGIQEIILSAGTVAPGEAEQLRQTYTDDNKEPQISQNINLSGSGTGVAVSVECSGYIKMLDKYIYSDVGSGASTSDLSQKIKDVITADPNGIFSTNFNYIDTNTTTVSRYDDDYMTARSAIDAMIPLGDASFNRYVWGVYAGRIVKYNAIPTDIKYTYDLTDSNGAILNQANTAVDPWDVVPGEFITINGLSLASTNPVTTSSAVRLEPGTMFIESVSYSAPLGVQLSGGKHDKVTQQINRLGLGGF